MKNKIVISIATVVVCGLMVISSCKKENNSDPYPNSRIDIVLNEIPFPTEKFMRVGYTLKTWEYEKDGFKLSKIIVINDDTKDELMEFKSEDIRRIYKEPISPNPFFDWNTLDSYYISIQVPIALSTNLPSSISHKLVLIDTVNNMEVVFDGGVVIPRKDGSPLEIVSPVKGEGLLFYNQSTCLYHFDAILFLKGSIFSPERFAFDNMKLNPEFNDTYVGDPTKNESYVIYRDTLFAVADSKVVHVQDGRPENSGNLQDIEFNTADEYGGNYLTIEIDYDKYAFYAHIIPGSFLVNEGDIVNEGDPIALLGNSGNSTEPHLHFHVSNSPDLWEANGIPIVLKEYLKIAELYTGFIDPVVINNAMMEQFDVVNIYY